MEQSVHLPEANAEPESPRGRFGLGSIVLLVSIVVAAVIFGLALSRQNQTQPTNGAAPDFSFTTFEGESLKLSDFKDKVVVINFWASWCGPCRDEAGELQSAWEYYQPRGDVVFLGIAYADNGPRSLEFIEEFGITYLNAPDIGTRISEDYNILGVPETFIIDQRGQVAKFIYAGVTQESLQAVIDPLLVKG